MIDKQHCHTSFNHVLNQTPFETKIPAQTIDQLIQDNIPNINKYLIDLSHNLFDFGKSQ